MNGHGRGEGRGVVAPLSCHQGWTFPPLRGVSCAICSLWLWDPYGKVFSFPATSLFLVYQQISAAAKLGRWGTQHKDMAHPLTQPVRCCWSSPCEFVQALWGRGNFCFRFGFGHPGFPDVRYKVREMLGGAGPICAGPGVELLWVRACGGCAQKKREKSKVKGRRTHPLLCFMQLILVML